MSNSPTFLIQHPILLSWLALALLFGIGEILLPFTGLVFSSAAAVVAALTSIWIQSWEIQVLVFASFLLVSLFLLRPRFIARLQTPKTLPTRMELHVGKIGMLTEGIDSATGTGRVLIDGQDWSARSDETPLLSGTQVLVLGMDGISLRVRKVTLQL